MRTSAALALLGAALLSLAPAARAQTATGSVNGTITDKSGGSVPAATVKLTNQATGIETIRSANESGAISLSTFSRASTW